MEKTTFKKTVLCSMLVFLTLNISAQNWTKVWSDEFNQTGSPDSTKWNYDKRKGYNDELEFYTNRSENVLVKDTTLIIEAIRDSTFGNGTTCTSGSIFTQLKGDWKYGKIEVRAKIPTGNGTWPAIWLMPTNSEYGGWPKSGEIDIMENIGCEPTNIYMTNHFEGTNGSGHESSGSVKSIAQPYNRFVKYSIIWTPDSMSWYLDDVLSKTYKKTANDHRIWPYDKEFYLILNLAIGGSWAGQKGIDDNLFPQKMYVDYVRVYQLQDTIPPYTLTIPPSVGGNVTVNPSKTSYNYGDSVTLMANSNPGYYFQNWLYWGGSNSITVPMYKNLTMIPIFKKQGEIIRNGDFLKGLLDWNNVYINNTSTMAMTPVINSGAMCLQITKPGTSSWTIGNQQTQIPIMKSTNYQLTFDCWSDNASQLFISISKNYDPYTDYLVHNCSITTTKQTYSWNFTPSVSDTNCRLYFGVGSFPVGNVCFDNISLIALSSASMVINIRNKNEPIRVYPNPATDKLYIRNLQSTNTALLYNYQGQLLKNKQINNGCVDISNLSGGIYIIKIIDSDCTFTSVFIKK